jgi:ribosomal-protein-alanine N-acetyltransferase
MAGFTNGNAGLQENNSSGNKMSAVLKRATIVFRPMSEMDMDKVMEIEEGVYEFPWSIGIFQDCLSVGYCCWILEQDDRVSGYGIMSVLAGEADRKSVV